MAFPASAEEVTYDRLRATVNVWRHQRDQREILARQALRDGDRLERLFVEGAIEGLERAIRDVTQILDSMPKPWLIERQEA